MTLTDDKTFPQLQYFSADNIHSAEVTAVFTTRNGGVSGSLPETEHYRSMNLQFSEVGDSFDNVAQNYGIIASSQGFRAEDVISLHQKHTDRIIAVRSVEKEGRPIYSLNEEADALVTDIKGVLLSVRTADCVPILLYDSVNGAIAAVHSGWRGTFLQIAVKTLKRMADLYGTDSADVQAAIGAAIGMCCYEVDEDLYERFHDEFGGAIDAFFKTEHGGKPRCDLIGMNKAFLLEAGITERNIDASGMCTMCNPGLFFSHRRSGFKRGSMAAFIGLRP